MTTIQGTAIIRDRGQLTIPEKIREVLKWSSSHSVVSIAVVSQNELVIKPYEVPKQINWNEIWSSIEISRSYRGKRGNLSEFIKLDRKSH